MNPKSEKTNDQLAGVEGLEPPTHGLEIRCSIHLSYTPSQANAITSLSVVKTSRARNPLSDG
jgi:hypothetical protein